MRGCTGTRAHGLGRLTTTTTTRGGRLLGRCRQRVDQDLKSALRPDASLPPGFRVVAPDPELGYAEILGSQGHSAEQCEDRRDGVLSETHQVQRPCGAPTDQRSRRLYPAGVVGCSRRPTTPHEALDHVFLTVANSRSQSSQALMDEVALLRKEVVALRSQRSRSPRGQRAQKQPLALKDKASAERQRRWSRSWRGQEQFQRRQEFRTPKEHTSFMSSSRSTRTHCGTRKRMATQVSIGGSRGNSVKTQRSATENTFALAALVQGFRTTTVCVSKQGSERHLLLNFVMLVQIPLMSQ